MTTPQLLLLIEARVGEAALARIQAALSAVRISSVVLIPLPIEVLSADHAIQASPGVSSATVAVLKPIVALVQAAGVAVLIDRDVALARATAADGVHLVLGSGHHFGHRANPQTDANSNAIPTANLVLDADPAARISAARIALGKGQIIGIEIASGSRHHAMLAGEAGADYVAFAGPEQRALVEWWSQLFVTPCVALGGSVSAAGEAIRGVSDPHETADLAEAGADFIAVAFNAAQTAADIQAAVRLHAAALDVTVA